MWNAAPLSSPPSPLSPFPQGYAVASVWLAALFARTEACLRARSRLTERLLALDTHARRGVAAAAAPLAETSLPALFDRMRELRALLSQMSGHIEMQEGAVRPAKAEEGGAKRSKYSLASSPIACGPHRCARPRA